MPNRNNVKPIVMNKRDLARIAKIKNAGATQTMLAIKYKDKKGKLSQRTVEPYKLNGNDFWAYDPNKESIRRFKIKQIQSLKPTRKPFSPRWKIETGEIEMMKQANNYYGFNSDKKIQAIEDAFKNDRLAKEVAYMIATSHEYKEPNTKSAIKLVKNYKWSKQNMNIDKMQGINKPVDKTKVFNMAGTISKKTLKPFMVVDKFQGIMPQSKNHKILLDGHHRKEACELKGINEVPVYYGKYTGNSEKDIDELIEKKSSEILGGISKMARAKMKDNYSFEQYNSLDDNGIEDKKNRTSFVKDRILPNARNKIVGDAAGVAGAITGAGLGYATTKIKQGARNEALKKVILKGTEGAVQKGTMNQNTAEQIAKIISAPGAMSKARGLIAAGAGAIALAPKAKEFGKVVERTRSLRKKHLAEFGTEPTEDDYKQVAKLKSNNKIQNSMQDLFYTPESVVKSKKRDLSLDKRMNRESDKQLGYRKFATEYIDDLVKIASVTVPKVTAITLATPSALLGGKAADVYLDPDSKHRKAKILGVSALSAGAAGTMGHFMGKDGVAIYKEQAEKLKPIVEVIKNRNK